MPKRLSKGKGFTQKVENPKLGLTPTQPGQVGKTPRAPKKVERGQPNPKPKRVPNGIPKEKGVGTPEKLVALSQNSPNLGSFSGAPSKPWGTPLKVSPPFEPQISAQTEPPPFKAQRNPIPKGPKVEPTKKREKGLVIIMRRTINPVQIIKEMGERANRSCHPCVCPSWSFLSQGLNSHKRLGPALERGV